jgi:hypothetical protein
VTAVNSAKIYDGTISSAGTPTLNPSLAPGDTTTTLSQSFESATAGTNNKIIIPAITLNDGNNGANYAVTLVNFTSATIHKAPQTITFDALADAVTGPVPFQLGASASSGLTVSYASSNPAVATVTGNTVTIVSAGTTTITASQAGDDNFNAAASVDQTLTVTNSQTTPTTVIANFGNGLQTEGAFAGGIYSSPLLQTPLSASFNFDYPLSGPGPATKLRIPATASGGGQLQTGGGHGIAVTGGANNAWWEEQEGSLAFVIAILDASDAVITTN